jgi:hypothetical protein
VTESWVDPFLLLEGKWQHAGGVPQADEQNSSRFHERSFALPYHVKVGEDTVNAKHRIIEPLGTFFLWEVDPRIIETSLLFLPTNLDPSGSIIGASTGWPGSELTRQGKDKALVRAALVEHEYQ